MPVTSASTHENEWITLQNQFDSYEKFSLIIKLSSVLVCTALLFHETLDLIVIGLCGILWLLDGIWKTFQNRISERLLVVEQAIVQKDASNAYQYNSHWLQNRPSSIGLVKEYVASALSPTVAAPHGLLVLLATVSSIWL